MATSESVEAPLPDEMDKFTSLLNDYLKSQCHYILCERVYADIQRAVNGQETASTPPVVESGADNPDDYVWDVFYHRPATLSEWNEVANIATL